jgi:hypothetical protein
MPPAVTYPLRRERRRKLHPFDVMFVLLIAIGAIPIGAPWTAVVWLLVLLAVTSVVHQGGRERAHELATATGASPAESGWNGGGEPRDS